MIGDGDFLVCGQRWRYVHRGFFEVSVSGGLVGWLDGRHGRIACMGRRSLTLHGLASLAMAISLHTDEDTNKHTDINVCQYRDSNTNTDLSPYS